MTDQVSVDARFGSSGNPGRPTRFLPERCAIYPQPHRILLGYVCDRFARCDSACREPLSSGSPQTAKPSPLQWFHIGCLKFAAERNIVPNGNAVPKQAHQEKPWPLCWRETILRFNVYWMCRACPGIPKEASNAASALPRLGPFLFGPAIYPQRKLPVYKNQQRQRARYDRLSDGCRSRPTVSKRGRDKTRWPRCAARAGAISLRSAAHIDL